MTDVVAIVLAGGSGERLGADVPKAFVPLAGRPLLVHAVESMLAADPVIAVVVAVPSGWEVRTRAMLGPEERCAVVTGGPTRGASVRNALAAVDRSVDVIVCHDAARALAPASLVVSTVAALSDADGAVPALPVTDTVKKVADGFVVRTEPRDGLVTVQTPQAFRATALRDAHSRADEGFTDDAMALEAAGFRVRVVPGDPLAHKITTREDLMWAEAHLAGERSDV